MENKIKTKIKEVANQKDVEQQLKEDNKVVEKALKLQLTFWQDKIISDYRIVDKRHFNYLNGRRNSH